MKRVFIFSYLLCLIVTSVGCAPTRMFFCPFPTVIEGAEEMMLEYDFYVFPWDNHLWVQTEIDNPTATGQTAPPDLKCPEPEVYLDGIPLDTRLTEWGTFRDYIIPIKFGKHTLSFAVDKPLLQLMQENNIRFYFQVNGSISGPLLFYWRNTNVLPDRLIPILSEDEICPTCERVLLKDNTIRKGRLPRAWFLLKENISGDKSLQKDEVE